MKRLLATVLLLAASGLAAGQPVLEFRKDLGFSAAEVHRFATREFSVRLDALERAGQLEPDPALQERLDRIFSRLLRAAAYEREGALNLPWELHACGRCEENAAAMAGGKMLVSGAFVAALRLTDDELAYLLGHEMAHVLAEHTREFATAARYFVANGMRRYYADIQRELDDNLAVLLRMRQISAQQELDADRIGFILGARAGFVPEAMLSLLGKLRTGGRSLIGSHPADDERLVHARAMLETARRIASSSSRDD